MGTNGGVAKKEANNSWEQKTNRELRLKQMAQRISFSPPKGRLTNFVCQIPLGLALVHQVTEWPNESSKFPV
jgi:hypothetical protein